jgi:hypothetical protein
MTERWRKKLRDLDKVGPGDDVFQRAKAGPSRPDDEVDRGSTERRVVTGVVAFAVFALALSVFLIPALRMRGDAPGSPVIQTFPIWPAQDDAALAALQQKADTGEADWLLDPEAVARQFGAKVMGWSAVDARQSDGVQGCIFFGESPRPMIGNVGGCSSPSIVPDDTMLVFRLTEQCRGDVCPAPEVVQVYQPLQQGPGGLWTVYQAQSTVPYVELTVTASQRVHEGASIGATFYRSDLSRNRLGYGACGGPISQKSSEQVILAIDVDLSTLTACSGEVPGYAWGATATSEIPFGYDPLAASAGLPLMSLTAVPILVVTPEDGSVSPGPSVEPSLTTSQWTTYTDRMGWTMDVPTSWESRSISNTSVTGIGGSGQEFTGDGVTMDVFQPELVILPADDSTFPLDYDSLLSQNASGALVGSFRGDGEAFAVRITFHDPSLGTEREAILRRMIGSISFEPWHHGDSRNGWTQAWDGLTNLPKTSPAWVSANDAFWIVTQDGDARSAYGPVEFCNGASTSVDEQAGTATIACANGANGTWDSQGNPAAGNWQGWNRKLDQDSAIVSWDGYLLLRLP